ncbi:MAG: hypothetical protein DBX60_05355 [Bacillota bacterium]|nr:MAG: hypothetical protein DBX60_05355 [Bacillota bacterium]
MILYKFFSLPEKYNQDKDHYNIKNLRDNILTCNHPILFNDPFEGILFAKGISEQESLEIEEYKRKVEKQIPSNKKSLFWTKNSIVTNKNIVCCFVRDFKDNPFVDLMWAHYANSHFGYCMKFEFSEKPEDNFVKDEETGGIQIYKLSDEGERFPSGHEELHFPSGRSEFKRVQYKDKPQIFQFDNGVTHDSMEDFLQIKSKVWEYEKEVRLILHLEDCLGFDLNKFYGVKYDVQCIKGIYWGMNTLAEYKKEMIEILESQNCLAPRYSSYISGNSFRIQYKLEEIIK